MPAFPPLILGMMRLEDYPELTGAGPLARWIGEQLDKGLNTFDHADIYGGGSAESAFGAALAYAPSLKEQIRIITKTDIVHATDDTVKHYRAEPGYVAQAIDNALARLNIDQIDTFLIHRPDPLMDAEGVANVLEEAVRAGKISQIGVSNFLPEQWRWLQANTDLPLVCNQSELSLTANDPLSDGVLEAHLTDRLQWLAWSPLGGGSLAKGRIASALKKLGAETGLSPTALAIAWLRQIPGNPIPVLGSMKPTRIDDALTGAEVGMSRTDWFTLLEAARGKPVP
ncbi:aldo/keto reductase [Marinobacter sp. BGYM27]|uniref:aldo/keto reductase n=1 Tax=Marinobacter sp. BGYM27 TaxID=2975597 RepID=UPI0021A31A76|nr:aldo/keto reductase [Marinobacter sp. BGYM27]MDG5500572.1 aldo/keto reductase [Marinobacter sp. BGYM27]